MPFDFGDSPVNYGEMTTVSCLVAKGDLPLDIFWSLNAIPIVTGQRGISVSRMNARTSFLSVESLDAEHGGTYRCMARNGAGSADFEAVLRVNGVPRCVEMIIIMNVFRTVDFWLLFNI